MVSGSCKNRQSIDYVARKVETYAAMRGCVDRFRNVFPYVPREIALWGKKWRLSVPGPYGGLTGAPSAPLRKHCILLIYFTRCLTPK